MIRRSGVWKEHAAPIYALSGHCYSAERVVQLTFSLEDGHLMPLKWNAYIGPSR
jgi:hypothetical protein